MQIYRVTGKVTLSRCHPSLVGGCLVTAEPAGEELVTGVVRDTDTIVVWDDLGSNAGTLIAVSDGAEAAQPFRPELKPVDAYCSAILERVEIAPQFRSK